RVVGGDHPQHLDGAGVGVDLDLDGVRGEGVRGRDVLVAVLGGVVVRADELALNGEGPVVGGGEQGRQVAHGDPVAVVPGVAVGPPHVGRVGVELVGGGADQGVPQLRGGLLGG